MRHDYPPSLSQDEPTDRISVTEGSWRKETWGRQWQRQHQAKASERFFDALLKEYDVVEDSLKLLIGPLSGRMR